jgi:DNA-binding transcriptional LysR family regulator
MHGSSKDKAIQRRHIEALVAVADSLSVHAAAREIGMPQPALSRLISEAEQLVGARLFERSSHGCTPTTRGHTVLTQARFVLRGLRQLNSMIPEPIPSVRLGCIPRAMYTLMPRLLDLVYPACGGAAKSGEGGGTSFELSVTEGSSMKLMEDLSQGKLDFAILQSTSTANYTELKVGIERLYDDKIVVICAAQNEKFLEKAVALRNLPGAQWVLPGAQTTSRIAFDTFLQERNITAIKPVMEVRSFEANLALVAGTRFLSIAPESIARRYLKMGLRIVQVKPALPSSPVMLAHHREHMENPPLQEFRELLFRAGVERQ